MSTDSGPSNNTPTVLGGVQSSGTSAMVSRDDHQHSLFQTRALTVAYTDLTVDMTDGTQTINLGAVLPVAAVPVAAQVTIGTPFAGVAAPTMDVGVAGGAQIDSAFAAVQSAGRYVLPLVTDAQYDGAQLTLKFTPASGQKLKSGSSAGSLNVTVYFFVAY